MSIKGTFGASDRPGVSAELPNPKLQALTAPCGGTLKSPVGGGVSSYVERSTGTLQNELPEGSANNLDKFVLVATFILRISGELETISENVVAFRSSLSSKVVPVGVDINLSQSVVESLELDKVLPTGNSFAACRNSLQFQNRVIVRLIPYMLPSDASMPDRGVQLCCTKTPNNGSFGTDFHRIEVCTLVPKDTTCSQAFTRLLEMADQELLVARSSGIAADIQVHVINDGLPVHIRGCRDPTRITRIRRELGLPASSRLPSSVSRVHNFVFCATEKEPLPRSNIHLRAKEPDQVDASKIHLVRGRFDYYHYGMQNLDDRGWGCAYRSLQMMLSYFHYNGYSVVESPSKATDATQELVPNVIEVQKRLKEMNVMDTNFQPPCKQWIGSQEISWILSDRYDVDCRFIRAHGDYEDAFTQIEEHLVGANTPVVACGANLALVIAGTARTALGRPMAESKLLIVDPHYYAARDDNLSQLVEEVSRMEGYSAFPVGWRTIKSVLSPGKRASTSLAWTLILPMV